MEARVVEYPDPAAFLDATADFRAAEPVFTNVIGSVAGSVLAGRAYESCRWMALLDDAGAVVGCAMRTAPWKLVVSAMPASAAGAVGRHMTRADPGLPGIVGPPATVDRVVEGAGWGARARVNMDEIIRVLGRYTPPRDRAPGAARVATAQDRDLVLAWMRAFAEDAGLPTHGIAEGTGGLLERGSLRLWEVDGSPVSMAGHAPVDPTPSGIVARVGPVYTPAALRGRGYGTAATSAVVEALLPACAVIMLVTDAANATSNRVYARLGFEEAGRLVEVLLA
ncbi:MAG: GNAT family N-acetyltransferase [Candidatus Nanopelagicales bacterium]